jgi:hypothetical protein
MRDTADAAGRTPGGPNSDVAQERPFGGPLPASSQAWNVAAREAEAGLQIEVRQPRVGGIAWSRFRNHQIKRPNARQEAGNDPWAAAAS